MARCSNNLIGCLNLIILLLSIPVLAAAIYLTVHHDSVASECQKLMGGRELALAALLFVVSFAGFVGACFRVTWLMWVYLVLMLIIIVLHVAFIVFDFVVSEGGSGGEVAAGRGFKEYHLEEYSKYYRDAVEDKKTWSAIRSCLVERKVCKNLEKSGHESYGDFYMSKLSPIESGCCKPPSDCGFNYKKPTVWNAPAEGFNSTDRDCTTWSNTNTTRCYDCDACKAGYIADIKTKWRNAAIINTVFVAIQIILYCVACRALRNNKEDNALPKLKGFTA